MSARCSGLGATSAARFFVQLSRSSGSAPRPAVATAGPVLDVLLPRRPALLRPLAAAAYRPPPPAPARRAAFSTTSARRGTVAVHNPQKDDEGRDMTMEITPRAAERLSKIMTKDANPNLALRIQVESGGCHGFQYLMSLTTLPASFGAPPPPTSDKPGEAAAADVAPSTTTSMEGSEPGVGEDDTVFAYFKDENGGEAQPAAAAGAPKIIMDGPSLELLKGSKVDFTMELIGSQFKIVDNPLATSSCGCGTSFDIKM